MDGCGVRDRGDWCGALLVCTVCVVACVWAAAGIPRVAEVSAVHNSLKRFHVKAERVFSTFAAPE